MTANQRRPGFRLPWSPDADASAAEQTDAAAPAVEGEASTAAAGEPSATAAADSAPADEPTVSAEPTGAAETAGEAEAAPAAERGAAESATEDASAADAVPAPEAASTEPTPEAAGTAEAAAAAVEPPATATTATGETSDEFMRDLVAAMRGVADEAREAGMSDLRGRADEQVRQFEADATQRQESLRSRADADVAGIGDWANAEAERIKTEAEQRVIARRAQLDQQLAADAARTEAETRAVRDRVAEYERELAAYHTQLSEITDPAAFAAAAKRMPRPPTLAPTDGAAATEATPPSAASEPASAAPTADAAEASAPSDGVAVAEEPAPTGEEALAARLAQLDATLPTNGTSDAAAPTAPVVTEIIVKGLGSFGAITGFRQSLSGVEGVEAVALSLGQTGEFVFRATHAPGFDVRSAIAALEGDGAKIEDRSEGGLRVVLDRPR